MNKLTTGADSTLGEHLKLACRFFGEQSKQAAFLRQKIELAPHGEAEEVFISEREMVYTLFALDGVKPPPNTLSRKPTMSQPVTTNQPVTPEGKRPPLFAVWATFHQLWGDAHAHVYQKLLWERMQAELQRVEALLTPTAEPAERIELGSVSKRTTREEGLASLAASEPPPRSAVDEASRRRVEDEDEAEAEAQAAPASYVADMPSTTVAISVDSLLRHLGALRTRPAYVLAQRLLIDKLSSWIASGRALALMRQVPQAPPAPPKVESGAAPTHPVQAAYAGEFAPGMVVFSAGTLRTELLSMIEQESAYDQRRSRLLLQQLLSRIQDGGVKVLQRSPHYRAAETGPAETGPAEQELRGLVEKWTAAELEKAKPEILRTVRRWAEDYVAGQKTASPSLEGCETT